jgi:hypothetical protein
MGEVPEREDGLCSEPQGVPELTAAEGLAAAATNACTAAGRPLMATAADRLFDDFVIIVMIGVAVGIAIYIMRALKKFFSGMVG